MSEPLERTSMRSSPCAALREVSPERAAHSITRCSRFDAARDTEAR